MRSEPGERPIHVSRNSTNPDSRPTVNDEPPERDEGCFSVLSAGLPLGTNLEAVVLLALISIPFGAIREVVAQPIRGLLMVLSGVLALVVDLALRRAFGVSNFSSTWGCRLGFMPVWIWGLFMIAYGLAEAFIPGFS
jgi:hypothetical protein